MFCRSWQKLFDLAKFFQRHNIHHKPGNLEIVTLHRSPRTDSPLQNAVSTTERGFIGDFRWIRAAFAPYPRRQLRHS